MLRLQKIFEHELRTYCDFKFVQNVSTALCYRLRIYTTTFFNKNSFKRDSCINQYIQANVSHETLFHFKIIWGKYRISSLVKTPYKYFLYFFLYAYIYYYRVSTFTQSEKIFFAAMRIVCKIHREITSVFHVSLRNLYWCLLLLGEKVVILSVTYYYDLRVYTYSYINAIFTCIHSSARCWFLIARKQFINF